jgi:hypothetical protein
MNKIRILLLFVAGLLLSCNEGPSTVTSTENLSLKAGQYMSIPFNMNPGELAEGSFTVQGPANLDIKFAVQDPNGNNVYVPVRLRSGSFTYRAQMAGVHSLFIDNTFSISNGKIVRLAFRRPRR